MADNSNMQAAEYVLGTLNAAERHSLERRIAREPELAQAVADWAMRFAPLDRAVDPVAPPSALWNSIQAELPALLRPALTLIPGGAPAATNRAVSRWRALAIGMSALAAMLIVGIVTREMLQKPQPNAQLNYVAVVNRGGDQPALIVRVDLATGTVLVRPVSTETPADKSLELWVIKASDAPKSMGVIGRDVQKLTLPVSLKAGDDTVFALTVEQIGGSPTGSPTSAPVYAGKLMPE